MIVCVIDFPTVTAYFGSCFTDISLDLTAPLLWSYQSYPYFAVNFSRFIGLFVPGNFATFSRFNQYVCSQNFLRFQSTLGCKKYSFRC